MFTVTFVVYEKDGMCALRCAGNQAGTSRITLMNVSASPMPSTTRAAYASGSDAANANIA